MRGHTIGADVFLHNFAIEYKFFASDRKDPALRSIAAFRHFDQPVAAFFYFSSAIVRRRYFLKGLIVLLNCINAIQNKAALISIEVFGTIIGSN